MSESHIYRLSHFRKRDFKTEMTDRPSANLEARPVFAGPDAAIEIEIDEVRGFINGEPSHPGGQLAKFIDRHRDGIVAAAASNIVGGTQKVIFSGTWHHIDFDVAPRFEGCLTHAVSEDGSVMTKVYDEHVFEWDRTPYRVGYGFITMMHGELDDFADNLDRMADHKVHMERGRYKGTSGLGSVGGMIWLANEDPGTPVLYSAATCSPEIELQFELDEEEAEYHTGQPLIGDGSLMTAVLSKLKDLKNDDGWFRGKEVDRSSNRPRKLKLSEAPDALDAIGYWVQVRAGERIKSSEFRLFGGKSEWEHEVLERVADVGGDDLLGNSYASDWIYEPTVGVPNQEIRILVLGPLPHLSLAPL